VALAAGAEELAELAGPEAADELALPELHAASARAAVSAMPAETHRPLGSS